MRAHAVLVLLVTLVLAGDAAADIYKCVGPDGKTVFTGDPNACPGAKPHVLEKEVQTVLGEANGRALRPGARPAARRPGGQADGLERMWRGKRPAAERELEQAEQEVRRMSNVVKGCNRGGEWYQTGENGIRQHIPCEELQGRLRDARQKRDELVEYLASGLEDECRKAGCQPGWIR